MSWPTITADKTRNLNAVLVTGAGVAVACAGCRTFGLQVVFTGGSPTVSLTIQGSNDGTNFFTLATFSTAGGDASGDIKFSVDKPVNWIRANLGTLSGGTNPTVSAYMTAV